MLWELSRHSGAPGCQPQRPAFPSTHKPPPAPPTSDTVTTQTSGSVSANWKKRE